jgi:hypothetical protein
VPTILMAIGGYSIGDYGGYGGYSIGGYSWLFH